jgi:hypothetical protein
MPALTHKKSWEIGLRAATNGMPGWSVSNSNGKIRLQLRAPGQKAQGVTLPLAWEPSAVAKATQLIGRVYKAVEGQQYTLKGALEAISTASDTMRTGTDWDAVAKGLKTALMEGRNEIKTSTWRDNYQPYVQEALLVLSHHNAPNDGHDLLKQTLERWHGKAASRAACCIAVRNLTDHAIARHRAPVCWRIDVASIKELRGKAPKKRVKAALEDSEILYLIDGVEARNPGWANTLKLLALYGLRPIELQHIQAKHREDGSLGMWCAYQKNCGGQLTDPRWIEPCPVKDGTGTQLHWNLAGAMAVGLLDLPLGADGRPRELNGHYVEAFLRRQPEWVELRDRCEARGEWLRSYTFRDSYSLRCHRYGIEVGAVAASMGHSVAVHSSSYRWSSEATTAAAFQKVLA